MPVGTGPWGTSPWGGGLPSAAGDVQIISVRFITPTYLRLHLSTQVIVNADYLSADNYTIAVHEASPVVGAEVSVVRVIAPTNDVLIADYIYLETTTHTNGASYTVLYNSLYTLDGTQGFGINTVIPYSSRITKTMQQLKNLPRHYDKRIDSLLHAVVSAISMQDDDTGGSRSDEFP